MIITCDSCGTSFKVKSSLIKETGSTVRCSKCQYLFIAYPSSVEPVTPIELMPDEKIETSIDETFGKEADEKIISEIFGDDDVEDIAEAETGIETGTTLRDLEAEIDADMSALSEEIPADLFEETETGIDEPEIFLSDLEEETEDMIDLADLEGEETIELEALATPEADDIIDIGSLLKTEDAAEEPDFLEDLESGEAVEELRFEDLERQAEEYVDQTEEPVIYLEELESAEIDEKEEDFIDLEAIEAEADQEIISTETVDAEEELDFERSETEDTVIIEAFEIGKDDVAQPEFVDFEDLETDEGGDAILLETVDAKEEVDFESLETAAVEEETSAAEFADVETETEGGVEAQLEEFEAEKEPEGEKPSEKAADVTGKKEPEEVAPAEEEAEFELEEAAADGKAADAEDLELEFDLDDTVAMETATETAEFELDFESELDEALAEEKAAETEDVELAFDIDETVALETPAETEEFELDLEVEEAVLTTSDEKDLGLDLDLEAFDLDLETVDAEDIGDDELGLGLEPEDIDLKTRIYDMDEAAEADAEEETFDLDLELASEDKSAAEAEDFVLDLDFEPEAKPDKEADAFELDFEEVIDEPGLAATEEDLDFGEEEVAPSRKTSEELDLSEIEDFLDFGEDEEKTQLKEPGELAERAVEAKSDTIDMDMDLDFETVTAPEEAEEAGDIDIDLETMIDEEIGIEKEVSLETTEERTQRITEEYRREADVVPHAWEEAEEAEAVEAAAAVAAPVAEREKREWLKPILVIILALLLSGVLIYEGVKFFRAPPKEVPVEVDPMGNLQIEMIRNPEYAFVVNNSAGELLVVTGHVTNRYDQPRSHIQVKATIYDAAGAVVVTSEAYCGNKLLDSDLSVLDLETINRRLTNRGGDASANVGVKPGARVPFTVVFSNLPENIDEMTVEVVASVR